MLAAFLGRDAMGPVGQVKLDDFRIAGEIAEPGVVDEQVNEAREV